MTDPSEIEGGLSKQPRLPAKERIHRALVLLEESGGADGEHHKAWVIDQVVRELLGNEDRYRKWVKRYRSGDDGPHTYTWDEGICP